MRLAAQARLGFYAIPSNVLELVLTHLVMPEDPKKQEKVCIIDPCCGEGEAIRQIRDTLNVNHKRTYAIELDGLRAEKSRTNLGESRVLGPASFFGTSVTAYSFGLAYVNPPFDDQLGGGAREELLFTEKATRLLVPNGILVLICAFRALNSGAGRLTDFLENNYEDLGLYSFPEESRKFKEVVVFGRKRVMETAYLPWKERYFYGKEINYTNRERDPDVGSDNRKWILPESWAPFHFSKSDYLPEELLEAVNSSPLNKLVDPPTIPEPKRPPLPLSKGHKALLLASGMLDGIVEPENEEPHVVRGSTRKVEYVASRTEEVDDEKGTVTKKTVISQRPVLTSRAVQSDGNILTLSDEVNTDGDDEQDEPVDED